MFERLEQIETKYEELNQALASPEVVSDSSRYQKAAKAHSELQPVVEKYREYKALTQDESDPEMLAYAHEELGKLEKRLAEVEEELKVLLLPKDPNDEKNVVLEIRAGTGGDEATLFAAEIFRMY